MKEKTAVYLTASSYLPLYVITGQRLQYYLCFGETQIKIKAFSEENNEERLKAFLCVLRDYESCVSKYLKWYHFNLLSVITNN